MAFRAEESMATDASAGVIAGASAFKDSHLHEELAPGQKVDRPAASGAVTLHRLTLIDAAGAESSDSNQGDKSEKLEKVEKNEKGQEKDILKYLIGLSPDNLGPGLNQAREAAKDLEAKPDLKQAAASFEPRFEAAVKKSDEDYGEAIAAHWGDLSLSRRDAAMKAAIFMTNVQTVNENMKAVPAEKREEVASMINLMQRDDLSEGLRSELRKSVGQYPDLLKSFDTAKTSEEQAQKANEAIVKAQEPLLKAAREQVASRYVLAEVLTLGGKTSQAFSLKQQAMEQYDKTSGQIIGQPVQAKPLLRA